jgi:hypothetical protein
MVYGIHGTHPVVPQLPERTPEHTQQIGSASAPTVEALPILMAYNRDGDPVWNTQFYQCPPYLPCADCLFFECPNAEAEYDCCPYATVYEVSERYDPYVGYGYEHLPRSANLRGWTFENTGGCRLYGLGLKNLAPVKTEPAGAGEESVADEDVSSTAE